ncbi:hypothetical protein [Paenibacillus sp. YN15]|uniref:hypothetical protein n=1 Tax=Paenibacillus sp. YN15 TaxID=1742774 RepID=UPI000DCD036F|nr:hypothetical protein [Paenibacillus sp. YN15]RAU95074.1 hypothetical protein DQG13_22680 [Paenibacillus sp. YN15]
MNKLLLFILLIAFCMSLFALQADEELAMHQYFDLKHGVNRAAHAGAQVLDRELLPEGKVDLDEVQARETALLYLRENLRLDEQLVPLPSAFLQGQVSVLVLDVIGAEHSFPYRYEQPAYEYSVTLNRPGVVVIIGVQYPRMYNLLKPVSWTVKGSAELVL